MRTFYDGDAYPALGLYFKFFDVAVSFLVPFTVPRMEYWLTYPQFITVFGGIAKLFVEKRSEKLE